MLILITYLLFLTTPILAQGTNIHNPANPELNQNHSEQQKLDQSSYEEEIKRSFQIGLKSAYSLNQVEFENTTNANNKNYVVGGLFFNIYLSSKIILMPEIQYSSYALHTHGSFVESTNYFKYIEIPLLLKFRTTTKSFTPVFFVGPNFGIPVRGRTETIITFPSVTKLKVNTLENLNDLYLSAIGGLGLDWDITNTFGLGLNFRAMYGITNIYKNSKVDNTLNAYQGGLGFYFNL